MLKIVLEAWTHACKVIIRVTKIMCNAIPPQCMRMEHVVAEILCKMRVCVRNKEHTNQEPINNQAFA